MVDELISTTDSTTNMSVFPNPANNELKISLIMTDDDYVFYVVDLNGLIIIKDTKTQIDISSLSDGHYILYAVRKNKHYLSEKFIKN